MVSSRGIRPNSYIYVVGLHSERSIGVCDGSLTMLGSSHLGDAAEVLMRDYENAYYCCKQRPTEQHELLRLVQLHKEVKPRIKPMQRSFDNLKALSDVLGQHAFLMHDDTAFLLFRCEYLSKVLPDAEKEAQNFLNEARWMAEADLRKSRAELSGQMLDFMDDKMQVLYLFDSIHLFDDYLGQIASLQKELYFLEKQCDAQIEEELKVGMPGTPFDLLATISATLQTHSTLWSLCRDVPKMLRQLRKLAAVDLNVDRILHSSQRYLADLASVICKLEVRWPCHGFATDMKNQVQQVVDVVPVLLVWTNRNIRERHWPKLFQILRKEADPNPRLILLGSILGWQPPGYSTMIQCTALNAAINNEHKLEEIIESNELVWESYALPIRALATSGTFYVETLLEAQAIVEESIIKIQNVLNMKAGTQEAIELAKEWLHRANYLQALLDGWSRAQLCYVSLRPLFLSKVQPTLSVEESFIFSRVEQLWRENMAHVLKQPCLGAISKRHELLSNFERIYHDLEFLGKAVEATVSTARSEFPRFGFVARQDVLDLITLQHSNIVDLQRGIGKIFPGVHSVELDDRHRQVVGLNSNLGESILLVPAICLDLDEAPVHRPSRRMTMQATHDVLPQGGSAAGRTPLVWLHDIEEVMWGSVHRQIDKARISYEFDGFEKWMLNHSQQALLVARSILYAEKVEELLSDSRNKRELLDRGLAVSNRCIEVISETVVSQGKGLARHKCVAAAVQELKQRDLLENLAEAEPRDAQDYAWQSQLRHSWHLREDAVEGRVAVHVLQTQYAYGLEYLGNSMPLVWSCSLGKSHCYLMSYTAGCRNRCVLTWAFLTREVLQDRGIGVERKLMGGTGRKQVDEQIVYREPRHQLRHMLLFCGYGF